MAKPRKPLVLVGFLMVGQVASIDFRDPTIGIPAFLTITIMPFTYSITNGIGVGILSFVLLKVLTGGRKEISFLMYGLAAAFLVYFSMAPIRALFLA